MMPVLGLGRVGELILLLWGELILLLWGGGGGGKIKDFARFSALSLIFEQGGLSKR